jgi:hypothetical protein
MPGIELSPDALLKGSARAGFRRLDMEDASMPDFEGVVASANIAYVLLGRTRFTVAVDRDVQFSYETIRPYYVLTGVGGSVRQTLGMGVDAEVRGSQQRLEYRKASDAGDAVADRLDKVDSLGGGIGYTFSGGTRAAFNADYYHRRSPQTGRGYEGLRAGLAVTYGF